MRPLRSGHHTTITVAQAYRLVGREAAQRLTIWILRRYLEHNGFTRRQAQQLIAFRWYAVTRRLIGS